LERRRKTGIGNYKDKMGETFMIYTPKNCKNRRGTIWDAEEKIMGSIQTKFPKETRKRVYRYW
jgi:hypothetical protein